MKRIHRLGVMVMALSVSALPAFAQVGSGGGMGSRTVSRNNPRSPYTVEFKTTHVQTLANGATISTEWKELTARDGQMRRMTATTEEPVGNRPAITSVRVNDPGTGEEISWSSATKTVRDVKRPVGADRRGCWATPDGRYRASFGGSNSSGPLQPLPPPAGAGAPVASSLAESDSGPRVLSSGGGAMDASTVTSAVPPGPITMVSPKPNPNNVAREDLGTDTIMGVEVRGSRTTITTPAGTVGNDQPLVSTNELWMAPSLGMALRSVNDDPRMGKTDREVVSVDLNEPDPALFQPPSDYKVEMEEMQPVPCGQ